MFLFLGTTFSEPDTPRDIIEKVLRNRNSDVLLNSVLFRLERDFLAKERVTEEEDCSEHSDVRVFIGVLDEVHVTATYNTTTLISSFLWRWSHYHTVFLCLGGFFCLTPEHEETLPESKCSYTPGASREQRKPRKHCIIKATYILVSYE